MRGALCPIRLKQIIGPHTDGKEFLHQDSHHVWIIIDSFQKNGLTPQRNPGVHKSCTSQGGLWRDLSRVVKMGVDVEGMKSLQHVCKLLRDTLGKGTGYSGSNAYDLNV